MFVPMAVAPQPEVLFELMGWVSTLSLMFVIVACIVMVRRRLKHYGLTKSGLSSVFVWISAAFVFAAVLLNTSAGPTASLFLSDILGVGYIKPITLAFDVFLIGVVFMVSAGIVAFLTHERKPKQGRKQRNTPQTEDSFMGTEVFSHTDR